MITPLLIELGTDVVEFAFWSAVAFIVGYTLLAKWWRSSVGWARISLDAGIALALSPTLLHVIFAVRVEDNLFFAWYQIAAVALVGVVSLWNLALVFRLQTRGKLRETARHVWRLAKGSFAYCSRIRELPYRWWG